MKVPGCIAIRRFKVACFLPLFQGHLFSGQECHIEFSSSDGCLWHWFTWIPPAPSVTLGTFSDGGNQRMEAQPVQKSNPHRLAGWKGWWLETLYNQLAKQVTDVEPGKWVSNWWLCGLGSYRVDGWLEMDCLGWERRKLKPVKNHWTGKQRIQSCRVEL